MNEPEVPSGAETTVRSERAENLATRFEQRVTGAAQLLRQEIERIVPEPDARETLREQLAELKRAASEFAAAREPEVALNHLLALESARAGIADVRATLPVPDEHRVVADALFRHLDAVLESAPLPIMGATPEESARQVDAFVKTQAAAPYAKILSEASGRAQSSTEIAVRSVLERLSNRIPSEKLNRLVEAASKLSGRAAFALSALGVGILALGSTAEAAVGDISVTDHAGERGIELRNGATGETVRFVTLMDLDAHRTEQNPSNPLFDRVKEADVKVYGVEYSLADPEAFTNAVVADAKFTASELDVSLDKVGPTTLCTLVSRMVERRLAYNYAVLEKDESGHTTPAAKEEDVRISKIPIDEMYLSGGTGVCRHYAALVEKVGETIIAEGLVPWCAGVAFDEVQSNELTHAWNAVYLNADGDGKTVAVAYLDATWHDAGDSGRSRWPLDALNPEHPSIAESAHLVLPLSPDELIEAYTKLTQLDLGGVESRVMHERVFATYFEKYRDIQKNGDSASPEATEVLTEMRNYALQIGILGDGKENHLTTIARERYFNATEKLIDIYLAQGNIEQAAALIEEGLSFANLLKGKFINWDFYKLRLNQVKATLTTGASRSD